MRTARLRARAEDVVVRLRQPARDGDHLLRGLPLAEHRLGDAVAERPMQVHPGEAEVLDGQAAETGERLLGRHGAAGDGLQQRLYLFPVHRRSSLALPLRNPCRSSVTWR